MKRRCLLISGKFAQRISMSTSTIYNLNPYSTKNFFASCEKGQNLNDSWPVDTPQKIHPWKTTSSSREYRTAVAMDVLESHLKDSLGSYLCQYSVFSTNYQHRSQFSRRLPYWIIAEHVVLFRARLGKKPNILLQTLFHHYIYDPIYYLWFVYN